MKETMSLHNTGISGEYDVLVIGAGPGGLAAAKAAAKAVSAAAPKTAAKAASAGLRVAVLERDEIPGGILNQCVHDGFGIVRYGDQLSGPEYAGIEIAKARDAGAEILTGCMVTEIADGSRPAVTDGGPEEGRAAGHPEFLVTAVSRKGRQVLRTKSIVVATGCRERTRGMLSIPGTRPAGIYTAGVAQNLINRRNIMVGRRIVILGSGDIGLIMARRLTLEGAEVICVAEVMEQPSGLARNVRQCLYDFDIPLYLRTGVSDIYGKGRLEAVELSEVDEHLQPVPGTQRRVACDTLILSVGLIPENEVAKTAGIRLNEKTGGAATDEFLQTSVPGIFACGNARAVMDLADFVSAQGEIAGYNAAIYASTGAVTRASRDAQAPTFRVWEQDPHNAARKGLPEEGSVTCTLCPKGCQVKVVPAAGEDLDVEAAGADRYGEMPEQGQWIITGNGCPRGEAFALQEITDPHRILTTTIRVGDGEVLLPVRSDRPVRLAEMQGIMERIRNAKITGAQAGRLRQGDVLLRDVGQEHVNIIAERSSHK